jgi:methionyl aminopeptidase
MVEIKSDAALRAMREAGRVVAHALRAMHDAATVGVSLLDLDLVARDVLRDAGASSPFLHYQPSFATSPYPAVICASVNDVIVHGIPTDYQLRDGDLLSIDCGATLDGWTGDAAVSFVVGTPRTQDLRLVELTRTALDAGISAAVPGAHLGDVGNAISLVARSAGYGMPRNFGGHGVGHTMHEDPPVPNEGRPGRGYKLRHGVVIAIEPMFVAGGRHDYRLAADGWSVHSTDGTRAAHFEHTIAVTDDGPRVLTAL